MWRAQEDAQAMLVEAAEQLEAEANKGDSGAGDGIAAASSKQVCQPASTSQSSCNFAAVHVEPFSLRAAQCNIQRN